MSKKDNFISNLELIKSMGYSEASSIEPLHSQANENGRVSISRSRKGIESKQRAIAIALDDHDKYMNELREMADTYGITKSNIKEAKKDIKEDERKKEKKKKKQAEKEGRLMDSYFSALASSGALPSDLRDFVMSGGEDAEKRKKKDKKKKKKKDKERSNMEGLTVKKKKKKKDKKKAEKEKNDKAKSEVAARFKEVEKISYANIAEIDETLNLVNERLYEITNSAERMRNKDYLISNYLGTKSSLISTRQKIATDIGANRAKIYEIELKQEKNAKDAASNDADLLARIFPGMVLNGNTQDMAKYVAENGKNKDSKKKKKKKHYDDNELLDIDDIEDDDELRDREKELMKSGDLEYSDYDRHIEFEGNFAIAIKKGFSDGKWKFIAIDSDGNQIKDFPKSHLPDKSTCDIKWDDERDMALDKNSNRSYRVFSVPVI